MSHPEDPGPTSRSSGLTVTVVAVEAFLAVCGLVFFLVYAIWWLATAWAP